MDKAREVETKFGNLWYLPSNYQLTEDCYIVKEYSDEDSLLSENSSIREKSVGSSESSGSIKNKLKETDAKLSEMKVEIKKLKSLWSIDKKLKKTNVSCSEMKVEMEKLEKRLAELELKSKTDYKKDVSIQTVDSCNVVNNTNSGFNLNNQNVFPAILEPESWQCSPTGNELLSEVYRRMNCTIDDAKKYFILNFIKNEVPSYVENSIRSKVHLPMKDFLQVLQFELTNLENTMRNYSINLYNNINDDIYGGADCDDDRICEKHRRYGPHAYYCEEPDECPYERCIVPRPRRKFNSSYQYQQY